MESIKSAAMNYSEQVEMFITDLSACDGVHIDIGGEVGDLERNLGEAIVCHNGDVDAIRDIWDEAVAELDLTKIALRDEFPDKFEDEVTESWVRREYLTVNVQEIDDEDNLPELESPEGFVDCTVEDIVVPIKRIEMDKPRPLSSYGKQEEDSGSDEEFDFGFNPQHNQFANLSGSTFKNSLTDDFKSGEEIPESSEVVQRADVENIAKLKQTMAIFHSYRHLFF